MLNERATELGRMIGQTPEYQTVKRASDALNDDKEAVALLERMERLRQERLSNQSLLRCRPS